MLILGIIVVVYCSISIQLYILNLQIKLWLTTLCFSCRNTRYKRQAWVSQMMGQTCEDLEEFCDILI